VRSPLTVSSSTWNRREFLGTVAFGTAPLLLSNWGHAASLEAAIQNPYDGIDWQNVRPIGSGSHIHCRSQRVLEIMYRRGLRHLAISNYYPSVPSTPQERVNQYAVEQPFATLKEGGYTEKPFRWNEILTDPKTGWVEELPEELRQQIPFEVGPEIFLELPDDVMICPNAEHHSTTDSRGHFNGLGSTFASGTFDVRNRFRLHEHGYLLGLGLPWKEAFQRILGQLRYPDGGGITINHPVWSGQKLEDLTAMLDFDPRVLGLEIWNHTCEQLNGKGWALEAWDDVLATGRRCWGFSVSDHVQGSDPGFLGYNVLLPDPQAFAADPQQACLKAYRDGQFYCVLTGDLQLKSLQVADGLLTAEVNLPCQLKLISAKGLIATTDGQQLSWPLPASTVDLHAHRYLRVEARQIDGKDRLFTQPLSCKLA